ncbi:MAG: mercury methylation corrinoid protein HgcA, partial [Deltaproteobacteria bacterium]|nr:mercury methylation corrinoid protein HgcA [Deltaproteobacteria bacterium]
LIPAISAYLAMNFTGASTYTSLSGVKKEMRWAVPVEIGAAAAGLVLWLGALFLY